MTQLILIVEDEPSIADNIAYALSTDGYCVEHCATAEDGLRVLKEKSIALVILDVGLPDLNGFEAYKKIQEIHNIPVIFLTARSSEVDRVVGLELGADDYVVKPFSPRELTARVRAVLRRSGKLPQQAEGDFEVDELRYQIRYCGKPLALSRYEYRIMKILALSPGRVFTRERLMDLAWEEPEMSLERTVDAHIKSIRAKMREVNADPELIVTHRGVGYSLKPATEEDK